MNKAELESKSLADLHALAAAAGVERYRMLPRGELIAKLADGKSGGGSRPKRESRREPSRRGGRGGRERGPREGSREEKPRGERRERKPREPREERKPREERQPEPLPPVAEPASAAAAKPKRKRRRRRWGRRPKGLRVHDLLLPAAPGRQAIVYGESREACTALLREVAAELSGASDGPDPIALLIDPSPEELGDWKREAPKAELVAAGQARHADDALAQAARRANGGEDVIVLVDSLTRFAASFAGPDEARDLFNAGAGASKGTLTVVAAVERQN